MCTFFQLNQECTSCWMIIIYGKFSNMLPQIWCYDFFFLFKITV